MFIERLRMAVAGLVSRCGRKGGAVRRVVGGRLVLACEPLEGRVVPSTVAIDDAWIQSHTAPYVLEDQPAGAATTYRVMTTSNITTAGPAFFIGDPNITLDLNGHTVTYDAAPAPAVANGDFAACPDPRGHLAGWDTTGTSGVACVDPVLGMQGQHMLEIANFTTRQTILSDPIFIADGSEYAAAISDKGSADYGTNFVQPVVGVTLSVVRADDPATAVWSGYDAGTATGSSAHADHGYSAFTTFVAPRQAVRLKITVTPMRDADNNPLPSSVDLGYAQVYRSHDFGVTATSVLADHLPIQLRNLQSMYPDKSVYGRAANFSILNGGIVQGTGVTAGRQLHFGYSSNALFFEALGTFRVDHVSTEVNGMDTSNLEALFGSNGTITSSTFAGAIDRISNRTNLFSAIHLAGFTGTADVENNAIIGVPDVGIEYDWGDSGSSPPEDSLIIRYNDISQNAIVSDAYGILIAGAQNFDIGWNHVDNLLAPMRGRGILLDGWGRIATKNGTIHDNTIDVYETATLEYGPNDLEVTAFRIRNDGDPSAGPGNEMRNLDIYNNYFRAHTDGSQPDAPHDAMGARLTESNPTGLAWNKNNADIAFHNNTVIAYAANAQGTSWNDANVHAQAFSTAWIDPGTGYQVTYNVFESNDTSLNLGENTNSQYGQITEDIYFFGNVLSHATYGTQWATDSYAGIMAGAFGAVFDPRHKVWILDTQLHNGATAVVHKPWDNFGPITSDQFNNDLKGIAVSGGGTRKG